MLQVLPLPNAEITPDAGRPLPQIQPNLATDRALCESVLRYILSEYWYPYEQMQMRFWRVWRQIDEMWRAKFQPIDMDLRTVNRLGVEASQVNINDGFTTRNAPADIHKQMDAILNIGMAISWADGQLPVQFRKGEYVIESEFYNPSQQSVDAANTLLQDHAKKSRMRTEYRKNLGSFIRYGHAWAWTDMHRRFEQDPTGETHLDLCTYFRHLNVDDVFTDLLMSCEDMDRHPSPFVRQLIEPHELLENRYGKENPFGWLNVEEAEKVAAHHYVFSQEDEKVALDRLKHRYNLSDQTGYNTRSTVKQLWTAYPLLRLDPQTMRLDTGEGIDCPHCGGQGTHEAFDERGDAYMEKCPVCEGARRVRPALKRWIVQFFGGVRSANVCLRIQEMPEGMRVPLKFAAHLVEDTSCAIPMSKAEIAQSAWEELATYDNLFRASKDKAINRGWMKKADGLMVGRDCDKPGAEVLWESDPNENVRVPRDSLDDTVTILPQLDRKEREIMAIFGATDTLLGMINQGRRSALEIGEATEAARNPIVQLVDEYNHSMMGGWADDAKANFEIWGDRDWVRKKTGREWFGMMDVFTAVGEEFVKKMVRIQNARYVLEASANDPVMMPARPKLWAELLRDMGMENIDVPDGGFEVAQHEAMQIVTRILGEGIFVPASVTDPHEIYIPCFEGALKDPVWYRIAPHNIPLMVQRLQQQIMLQVQQQQAMLQQQIMEQQLLNPPQEKPGGQNQKPKTPGKPAEDRGQQMQQAQG